MQDLWKGGGGSNLIGLHARGGGAALGPMLKAYIGGQNGMGWGEGPDPRTPPSANVLIYIIVNGISHSKLLMQTIPCI